MHCRVPIAMKVVGVSLRGHPRVARGEGVPTEGHRYNWNLECIGGRSDETNGPQQ